MPLELQPMHLFIALTLASLIVGLLIHWWYRRQLKPFELTVDTVQVGDWTIRYHQSGRGPHILLIHGIGANLYCWRWLIPLLAEDFRVTAIDLPGFGGSSKPKEADYGLDEQVERLEMFLDKMQMRKTYVVGNSMGGNIALWLAHLRPTRVLGVAVIAPATSPRLIPLNLQKWLWLSGAASLVLTRTAIRWAHRRTVSRKEKVDVTRIEETYRTYGRKPDAIRSFIRATEAIRDPRLPHDLKNIKTKVLLLWGDQDRLVSKKVIDELKAALTAADSHVHLGGGHHLQEDEPEWVRQKIVEFFTSTTGSTAT